MQADDNVIREFMRKHYPKYADNIALGRILYAKHIGAMAGAIPLILSSQMRDYENMVVKMSGVLAAYNVMEYQSCQRCLRSVRNCKCGEDREVVTRYVYELVVGDNAGNFRVVVWRGEPDYFTTDHIGKEMELVGAIVRDEDGELYMKAKMSGVKIVEVKANPRLDETLNMLREAKRIRKDVFNNLLRISGLSLNDIRPYVVEDGDYYVWSGEK